MNKKYTRFLCMLFLFLTALICCSCGKDHSPAESAVQISYVPGQTHVLVPQADGSPAYGCDFFTLDFSHADQGYFSGILTGQDKKVNIQVTGPDQIIYNYFMQTPEKVAVFPFTAGNGNYLILVFENIGDDQYASLFSYSLTVELNNEFLPYLYPNQYVNFTEESTAVTLASEITSQSATDLDALKSIYQYITTEISYDDQKADTVQSGYLPVIDETLETKKGICFDYAALTAAMLRSLSIPARLEIGYSSDVRHAWIDVYIESMGWVENAVEFNGNEWKLMDPTFASAGNNSKEIHEYIGNGDNYVLQYVR